MLGIEQMRDHGGWRRQLGVRRAQIERRGRVRPARAAAAPDGHPQRIGLAHRRKRKTRAQCCGGGRRAGAGQGARPESADFFHRLRRTAITAGSSTMRTVFPQQQIGFVAFGVMDGGGAFWPAVASAIASSVVTPISGFFSAIRRPRMKASPTRWPVNVPGPVVTARRSSDAKAMPAIALLHHGRQRFGMAARHFFKTMGQNLFAVQHRDRTGAQRGIDRQQSLITRILQASSKSRRAARGRKPSRSP